MRSTFIILLVCLFNSSWAQIHSENKLFERKGFMFGVGLGMGSLTLKTNDTIDVSFSTTLPNIKIGYMINPRLAVLALLPGSNYKYKGKDRGFEGFIIATQYWVKDKWWVLGGTGLTFDAPAFYTVKDPAKASFYTGAPAISLATGYEVWRKGKFALDVQYRIFLGNSNLPSGGHREGVSNMFIVGFNWY